MRIELNVKLEFDLNDATLDVLAARISSREVVAKIADEDFMTFPDGTNEADPNLLKYPIAVLSPIESFMWRNQHTFERG